MNRLATRLAVAIAVVAVVTILLVVSVQIYTESRQYQTLPLEFRTRLEAITTDPSLDSAERVQRMVSIMREVFERADENFEEVRPIVLLFESYQRQGQFLLIATSVLAVALGIALALMIARYLSRPITAVARAADRVAHGDLSARVRVPYGKQRASYEVVLLSNNFNAMAEALERLEGERKAMIADIAHELRTPLTILQGQIDAMQDGVSPLNEAGLNRLDRQTTLLTRLVEDLRTLSLAEAQRLSLQKQPLDLSKLAARVTASFGERAEGKGVGLEYHAPSPAWIEGDPDRLAQILGNLLDNALRHTPEEGRVEVEVHNAQPYVQVSVRDSGPGLSGEALEKAFNRFYRAETSRGRAGGGSGLGLAIVRALVEAHGGRVEAANHDGGGAVFKVQLPALPRGAHGG